ncbi:hypothetical protein GCM10009131_13480 [Morganella psychrotolerans]
MLFGSAALRETAEICIQRQEQGQIQGLFRKYKRKQGEAEKDAGMKQLTAIQKAVNYQTIIFLPSNRLPDS